MDVLQGNVNENIILARLMKSYIICILYICIS
jgi:hypothetical protein